VAAAAAVSQRGAARGEGETSRRAVGRADKVEEGATWLAVSPQPELAAVARLGAGGRLGLGGRPVRVVARGCGPFLR
jgi:hypothetical protein